MRLRHKRRQPTLGDRHRGHSGWVCPNVPGGNNHDDRHCRTARAAAEAALSRRRNSQYPGPVDSSPPSQRGDRCGLRHRHGRHNSEQAHVPAEQPSAREDPRLPAAHAHARRAFDPLVSAVQGPHPPLGLRARGPRDSRTGPVLAAGQRMRRREEFSAAVRAGRRAARGAVVVHVTNPAPGANDGPARAGLVIPKAVGGAVVRNKVRRRLRHLLRARLGEFPPGSSVVVRALPAAAGCPYRRLETDLDAALAAARTAGRTR